MDGIEKRTHCNMSYTNFLTSIHVEVPPIATPVATPVSTPTSTSCRNPKVVWTREMERKLLDLLLEQVNLGRKGEGGFRREAWSAIESRFNQELQLNLGKENFRNKLKTWKTGYRIMELQNTSGFVWNEVTPCVDAEDSVWDELLKRKEFRAAKAYRRQPFNYFNDLAVIVGNDMAEGSVTGTPQDVEDGNLYDDAVDMDDDDDLNTPVNSVVDLDEDFLQSNQSTASARSITSTPMTRRPKRRKASMAASLDVISESIHEIGEGINKSHTIKFDKEDARKDVADLFAALKAIPGIS